ncbi:MULTISPECIES: hypothetical protein [unclassified Pseudomonas]|uniref:hypothetical protein n=1 Tax=unclassified Pseudomonas TaxID=196821 RepID=UPI00177FBE3B|nr:hypothetical protein [Pseudomonas sp. PDM11]MBD9397423.1 hypothetical protein [Pseudomonas sp. PDM11]
MEHGLAHGGVLVFLLFTGHWRSLAPQQCFETKHNKTPFQYRWFGKWLDDMQAFWPLSTLDVGARSLGRPSPQQWRGLQLMGSRFGIDGDAEIDDLKLCFIMFFWSGGGLCHSSTAEKAVAIYREPEPLKRHSQRRRSCLVHLWQGVQRYRIMRRCPERGPMGKLMRNH